MIILNVLGTAYGVLESDDMPDGVLGMCDSETKIITLKRGMDPALHLKTLLHEFIHACDFESGVYQAVGPQIMEVMAETKARALADNFDIKAKNRRRKPVKTPARRAARRAAHGRGR